MAQQTSGWLDDKVKALRKCLNGWAKTQQWLSTYECHGVWLTMSCPSWTTKGLLGGNRWITISSYCGSSGSTRFIPSSVCNRKEAEEALFDLPIVTFFRRKLGYLVGDYVLIYKGAFDPITKLFKTSEWLKEFTLGSKSAYNLLS